MTWNHSIPQPPLPQGIRDALKDYPELLQYLQDGLNRRVSGMLNGPHFPAFEEAVWFFEGVFDKFYSDAKKEVDVAESGGDPQTIERAKAKRYLIGCTRMDAPWYGEHSEEGLWHYFQIYKGAFE